MAKSKKIPDLIINRLSQKNLSTDQEQVNEAKEVVQEVALLALSRAGLFRYASFHGGTALRIFYGLDRFSEDLDFALIKPDQSFQLSSFLDPIMDEFSSWGLSAEVTNRDEATKTVQKTFIKETSLGAVLQLSIPMHHMQKLHVKLEIDTQPPQGSKIENKLCNFPTDFYVTCHDIQTMFAGKLHALLCRQYGKGRDWYDLVEYLRRGTTPNLAFLNEALKQIPPISTDLPSRPIDVAWVKEALLQRIKTSDFKKLRADVEPFVTDLNKISLWSKDYFQQSVESKLN